MEKLEKLVAETKFSVYSRRVTLVVTGVATILIICVLSLFAAVVVLKLHTCSGGLSPSSPQALKDAKKVICLEPGCLSAAENAVEFMDPTVDPCDDFYAYACGGWEKKNTAPPDRSKVSEEIKLQIDSNDKIRKFLEKRSTWHSSPVGRKLKRFFRLCLHDYGRTKDSGPQLVSLLKDGLKSWLLNDNETWTQDFNLADMVEKAHADYMVPVLYKYNVWPDFRNTENSIISILPGSVGMGYSDFVRRNNKTRELYKDYMNQTVQLLMRDAGLMETLSAEDRNAKLEQFLNDSYAMERQVAYAIRTTNRQWRYFGEFTTIGELQNNFTELQLAPVLLKAFRHSGATTSTPAVIRYPDYMKNLNTHLRSLTNALTETEKKRYYSNYMSWTVLRLYSRWTSWEYRNLRYGYYESKTGRNSHGTTWYSCLSLMKSYFTLGLAGIFVSEHLNKMNKPKVDEMFENFKEKLQQRIDEFDWMQDEDKVEAKRKALQTQSHIGFPDVLSDQRELENMYSNFNFSYGNGLLWNVLQANHFYQYVLNHELQQGHAYTVWRYELTRYGYGSRPSFWWIHNSLLVPPGSLREPMFGPHRPDVINYGKLGVHMASRMFHVLDTYGRWTYNGTFNYWWNDYTDSNYTEAVQCITDFFTNQTLGPYLVDGENKTVQADPSSRMWRILSNIGGVSVAYKAYKSLDGSHRRDVPMPKGKGYNLHSDQLFFLAIAQMRCYSQNDKTLYRNALRKSLPDKNMINGMMSHNPEFLKAFKCDRNSRMYPETGCNVF